MSVTYKAFTDTIRREIWPFPGEAKPLRLVHSKFFAEAMIDLQKWIPCLKQRHTTVHSACASYVNCGITVVEAPVGVVTRVYTIANEEWCDKVFASSRSHKEVLRWQKSLLLRFTQPTNENMPALQQGYRFSEVATDSSSGRARTGIWSIDRGRFHLAPWLQSYESLVIEWDGEKKVWADDDVLDDGLWSADVAAAVKLFVQYSDERDYGCDSKRKMELQADYEAKRGDLIYWCMKRTENQDNTDAEELNTRLPTSQEVADDEPEEETEEMIAAFIGDYANGDGTEDVAELVQSWNPNYIVTGGDNWYGTLTTKADLDAAVGPHYGNYIYPYLGSLATGAERANNFYPSVGDHDRDPVPRLTTFQNYFNLRKPYYDFMRGNVHWFIVDQGRDQSEAVVQPDGNTYDSIQGESFRVKMALSTARWKVVVLGAPPYNSDNWDKYSELRWPFGDWGADLVLAGDKHFYERITAPEGYPLIIGGWSGHSLIASGAPRSEIDFQYDADFGALKLTVTCDEFIVQAINRGGTLIDSLTLTKP